MGSVAAAGHRPQAACLFGDMSMLATSVGLHEICTYPDPMTFLVGAAGFAAGVVLGELVQLDGFVAVDDGVEVDHDVLD